MIILKILAAPFALVLTVVGAMMSFLICMISALCVPISFIGTLLSLVLFISGHTDGGIVFLAIAFLISPSGIPAVAEWLVDKLHSFNYSLRRFIAG